MAVGLAWYLASVIFGHERPVFASIAALISLGVAVGRQWKRAIQVILGVGSGIALASFLVLAVGAGPLQMVLVVGLALGAAVFLGAEPLLMTQVGISAITAVGVEAPSVGLFSPERLLDALVGACVAVVINVLFPVDPERRIERSARPIFDELAATLEETAAALEDVDFQVAESALVRARRTDDEVDELRESLEAARDTARLSPVRRQSLGRLGYYEQLRSDSIESRVVGYSWEEAVSSSLCPYSPNVADSLRAQRERANERKGGAGRGWGRDLRERQAGRANRRR